MTQGRFIILNAYGRSKVNLPQRLTVTLASVSTNSPFRGLRPKIARASVDIPPTHPLWRKEGGAAVEYESPEPSISHESVMLSEYRNTTER